jgi:hypothetical protein
VWFTRGGNAKEGIKGKESIKKGILDYLQGILSSLRRLLEK